MNTIHRQNKIILAPDIVGWCAVHEGDEETYHRGFGRTKAEAIADLKRLDDEWSEAMEQDEEERSA